MELIRLAMGLTIAYAAHLGVATRSGPPWHRLRFLGIAAAASTLLQLSSGATPTPWQTVVAAGLSLVTLALAAYTVWAFLPHVADGVRAKRILTLIAAFVGAIFCGLLAGEAGRPLLARNAAAAVLHLIAWTLLAAFTLSALVHQLRGGRHAEETVGRNRLSSDCSSAPSR